MRALLGLLRCWAAARLVAATGSSSADDGLSASFKTAECSCGGPQATGWSQARRLCMKGSFTTCTECPRQSKCATISSLVGDGVRAFQGDCRALSGEAAGSQTCPLADQAALSYPMHIAIDDDDNVYISDHGNNRIRMFRRETGDIVTIAGTGLIGFSGDGGLATRATMRAPDGIALRPGLTGHATVQKELYFSDFQNQRIRKLVQYVGSDDWYIYTVVGSGTMGDNLDCDEGCDPLQANLNFPRALAFSSTQDLYIVDSGNLKVRKLTVDVGDPATVGPGVMGTFVGLRGTPVSRGEPGRRGGPIAYSSLADEYLPGHWEEPTEYVSFEQIYHIAVDNLDNLWVADSGDNRIMMVPLQSRSFDVAEDSLWNDLANAYTTKFAKSADERFSLQSSTTQGLVAFVSVIRRSPPLNASSMPVTGLQIQTVDLPYKANFSYWRYTKAGKGTWCTRLKFGQRDLCRSVPAQNVQFDTVMGFCFDKVNNMYVSDMQNSQVLHMQRNTLLWGVPILDPSTRARFTMDHCQCDRQWNYEGYEANNYCTREGSPTGVEWCKTSASACAGDERTPTQEWGFCRVPELGVVWEEIEDSAILGNAILNQLNNEVFFEETGPGATRNVLTLQRCKDRCALEPSCKALMAQQFNSSSPTESYWRCMYFGQVAPFSIYPLGNGTDEFTARINPFNSFFNSTYGVNVGSPMPNETLREDSPDLVSPDAVYPEAGLLLDDCRRICVANPACRGIAFPGCYLLNADAVQKARSGSNATNFMADQVVDRATTYVKKFLSEEVKGIAGYPNVKTFQGEGDYVDRAYLNRPGSCAVTSRGDILIADVWNMRIRTISGLIQDCVHSDSLFGPKDLYDYEFVLNEADAACTSHAGLAEMVGRMQNQVINELDSSLVESQLCRWANSSDPSYTANYTDNTLVLCRVCKLVQDSQSGTWPTSPLCPWEEMCTCHDRLFDAMEQPPFRACGAKNAYYDRWHRWVSSYVACLSKDSAEATWWTDGARREELKQAILSS